MDTYKTIADYVSHHKEIQYLGELSLQYKVNFYQLVDFALDSYNYQRRNGLDKVGAKMMALSNAGDVCEKAYNRGNK